MSSTYVEGYNTGIKGESLPTPPRHWSEAANLEYVKGWLKGLEVWRKR